VIPSKVDDEEYHRIRESSAFMVLISVDSSKWVDISGVFLYFSKIPRHFPAVFTDLSIH
jgi:hypothetical protein